MPDLTSIAFVTGSDPFDGDWGDKIVTRLLLDASRQLAPTRVIALEEDPAEMQRPVPVSFVQKPPLHLVREGARSLARRRSVIHTYFKVPELVEELRGADEPVVVAEHLYMAEAPLAAGIGADAGQRLLINTHVLESSVLARRRSPFGPLARLEARRTWRDELRCALAADSAACLGEDDLARLRDGGATNLERLDLLLPPAERPAEADTPRAVFVGTRHRWPPNQYAYRQVLRLWPRILAAVPEAELVVTGRPARGEREPDDPSVRVLGYVDDLGEVLSSSTLMLAPVPIGGGVRVKLLEAARHGLPIVATPEATGSIGDYLPVRPAANDDELVAAAVELLANPQAARAQGHELYEANRSRWESGFVQGQVERWLSGGA